MTDFSWTLVYKNNQRQISFHQRRYYPQSVSPVAAVAISASSPLVDQFIYGVLVRLCLVWLGIILLCSSAIHSMDNAYQAGQTFAQEKKASVESAARSTASNTVPGFTTDNPSQTNLSTASIGDAAIQEMHRSSAGQAITESSATRQRFKIDPEADPLLKTGNEILRDPYTAADVTLQEGKEEKQEDVTVICEEPGDLSEHTCSMSFVPGKTIRRERVYINSRCQGGLTINGGFGSRQIDEYKYLPDLPQSTSESGGGVHSWMTYTHNFRRQKQTVFHNEDGSESLGPAENISDEEYDRHPNDQVLSQDHYAHTCQSLEERVDQGLCTYGEKRCTQGPETRIIEGVRVRRSCWHYQQTYHCYYPNKNNCAPLRAQGCIQKDSRCKEWVGKSCVVYSQTYQCPSSKKSLKNIKAGAGSPFCITGNCVNSSYESNGEMLTALTQLSVFKEMQKDIRAGLQIFKGNDKRCSRNCVSFKDCCQGMGGWGTSLHLASCSEEEKLLAKLKQQKLCHLVGTYCAKKILGQCVSKKTSYCCFGNKLSRIVHEQGRSQLNIGWGSAENPHCQGFSPEQLGQLDFSRMDLSELFEEIMANFKVPDVAAIQTKTAKQLQENVKHIQGGLKKQPVNEGEEGGL